MAIRSDSAVLDALAVDLDAGYGAFVRTHSGAVYSAALRLSGSRTDAEDLAQEAFVRAYRALGRYDPERVRGLESRAWLLTITLNLWRNRLRRRARRPRETAADAVAEVVDSGRSPEAAAEAAEESRLLVGLLAELPEHHRVPVVLRHVVGLSYPEIASVLACPEGTAKANVARGLERLRALAGAGTTPSPPRHRPVHRPVHRKETP